MRQRMEQEDDTAVLSFTPRQNIRYESVIAGE